MSKKRNRSHRPGPARKPAATLPKGPFSANEPPAEQEPEPQPVDKAAAPPADKAADRSVGKPADKAGRARAAREPRRGELPEARVRGAKSPSPRTPVFWFGFEVAWGKLLAVRFVLFGLLALDAFLQIPHAPRYGAGGFNVGHFSFLDGLAPGRAGYELGQLVLAYLFGVAAFGVATRLVLPIAAALYAWLYFGSQLDSYQHHYLVALLVAIACFVPWQRPPDGRPGTRVASWALRLILVQLGILYLWAAISKMDPAWTSGATLGAQLTGTLRSLVDHTIGLGGASLVVILVELALAATIWLRPGWRIAAPLGIALHLGIAASGLEIGLFAYLMLGLYLLVLPDRLFVWLAERPPAQVIRRRLHGLAASASLAAWPLAIGAGVGIGALVRLEHALLLAVVLAAIPIVLGVHGSLIGRPRSATIPVAHLLALALWLFADRASSVAEDYYKFWGATQRRFGDLASAEHPYRRLVDVAPDAGLGHYHLGRILVTGGRGDEGARHLREAQRLEPKRARAYLEEARWLAAQGRRAEAIEKAREATTAEPGHAGARALLDGLLANRAAPAGAAPASAADDDLEKP